MPPKSPSGIPERVLSLLPDIRREKLSSLVEIKASNTTQVSVTSPPEDFIDFKIKSLQAEYNLGDAQEIFSKDALIEGRITKDEYEDVARNIPSREELDSIQGYLRVLEQRRKFVEDDLADIPPRWNINDDAYKSLILAKIEAACAGAPKSGTVIFSKQSKTNTLQYYGGSRLDQHGLPRSIA